MGTRAKNNPPLYTLQFVALALSTNSLARFSYRTTSPAATIG